MNKILGLSAIILTGFLGYIFYIENKSNSFTLTGIDHQNKIIHYTFYGVKYSYDTKASLPMIPVSKGTSLDFYKISENQYVVYVIANGNKSLVENVIFN